MFVYFRCPTGVFRIIKRTIQSAGDDNCEGLAAELAFCFLLALFPALIFVVAFVGLLPVQGAIPPLLAKLSRFAPHDVMDIVNRQLIEVTSGGSGSLLTLGMIGTVWSSSAAVSAIIGALNRIHKIRESRPWWQVKMRAILLTIGLIVFSLLSAILIWLGPIIANWLDARLHLGALAISVWQVGRWAGAIFLAALGIGILYNFGPDAETRWVWLTPGSLLAIILWIGSSLGFKLYLAYFGSYNATYGTIGGIIILLLWFYISSLSILLGAELNAKIDEALVEKLRITQMEGTRKRIGAALEMN